MLNKCILVGKINADPELRYIPSGKPVLNLRLASTRTRYIKETNTTEDETCFITVIIWGKRAENCYKYLKKGESIFIEGRLRSRSWEQGGRHMSVIEIIAEDIQFMNRTEEGTSKEDE